MECLKSEHASIGKTGAPVQGSMAVSASQLFRQPSKVSANRRDILPKLMLALPRLVGMQVSGTSNQDTLVVNPTPEIVLPERNPI